MFHFTLNGAKCGCDTLEELKAAVPGPNGAPFGVAVKVFGVRPEWLGSAGDELSKLLAEREKADKKGGKQSDGRKNVQIVTALLENLGEKTPHVEAMVSDNKARLKERAAKAVATKAAKKRKARYLVNLAKTPQELKDLPVVRGGVTWAATHRIAKKLGRDDFAQLRSDLAQKKKLAAS